MAKAVDLNHVQFGKIQLMDFPGIHTTSVSIPFCRPMNSMEKSSKSFCAVECQQNREIIVRERPLDKFTKTFTFDRVFGPESKQVSF